MKLIHSRWIGFLMFALIGVCWGADPKTPSTTPAPATRASDALIERVQKQLKTVETVEADFAQEKKMAIMKHTLKIRGHFALQKPNRMIWIVNEPVRYAISINGDEVRQWDEDTKKVQVIHLGGDPTFQAVSEQLQSWFMGNYKVLAQAYDVYAVSESPVSLRFVPKADTMVAKILESVEITFGKEERYIDAMLVREVSGSVTNLQFKNAQLNQPVKQETWKIPP